MTASLPIAATDCTRIFHYCDRVRHLPTGATGSILEPAAHGYVTIAWDDNSPSTDESCADLEFTE